jgi:hypothetical protein
MVECLYHCAPREDIPNIKRKGLIGKAKNPETLDINNILTKYKPQAIPDWITRSNCIFFYPTLKDWYVSGILAEIFLGIKIDIKEFELDLLYVADEIMSHRIWYLNKTRTSDDIQVPETLFKNIAGQYWDSLIPFKDYLKCPLIPIDQIEFLYFGDIPRSLKKSYLSRKILLASC